MAQNHKLQIYLRGLYNLYTYDILLPRPHIEKGKTPQRNEKKHSRQEPAGRRPGLVADGGPALA